MTTFSKGDLISFGDTTTVTVILDIVDGLAKTVDTTTENNSNSLIVDMFDLLGVKKVGHVELTEKALKVYQKKAEEYNKLSYEESQKLKEQYRIKKDVKNPKYFCTCYNKEHKFATKKDAVKFFTDAYNCSDGSEAERYANILVQLNSGKKVCSDVA